MDKKHAYLFCKFLQVEMKTIDIDKWCEGQKIKKDPGQKYVVDWVDINAKAFRENWETSICQHCRDWFVCGHKLKKECKNFSIDKNEED